MDTAVTANMRQVITTRIQNGKKVGFDEASDTCIEISAMAAACEKT